MISYLVSVKAFEEKNRTKLSNDFIFGFQERTIRHGNAKTLPSKTSRPICCIIAAKNTFIPLYKTYFVSTHLILPENSSFAKRVFASGQSFTTTRG